MEINLLINFILCVFGLIGRHELCNKSCNEQLYTYNQCYQSQKKQRLISDFPYPMALTQAINLLKNHPAGNYKPGQK